MTDHLTGAEVLGMHTGQIERNGGSQWRQRLRAIGSRPVPAADWLYGDLMEEAAALWGESSAEPCLH